MADKTITGGAVHKVPADVKEALISGSDILEKWNNLTPRARNEWIRWIIIVKKPLNKKKSYKPFRRGSSSRKTQALLLARLPSLQTKYKIIYY